MGERFASGHTVEEIKGEEAEDLKRRFLLFSKGVIKLHPGDFLLTSNFVRMADSFYNFKVRPTDIYMTSFPKSGTSWTQEIIWNLVHNPNLENPESEISIDTRFPNLEADIYFHPIYTPDNEYEMSLCTKATSNLRGSTGSVIVSKMLEEMASPRMIQTHLPFSLLPPAMIEKSKIFYVARDPRDVICSFYHFARLNLLWGFTGTPDEFLEDFLNGRIQFGPYWKHVKNAYERKDDPNFCLVFYEDLKNDIVSQVKRIDKFLGTNRNEKQIQNIVSHTSFSQLKERFKKDPPSSNWGKYFSKEIEKETGGFFRKGEIGDWKNEFTPEQVQKINIWMAKNLPQFGNNFKYKIENL